MEQQIRAQHSFVERIRGAAMLDTPTYEEVEADTGATGQAALVVALVAIASAIAQVRAGVPSVLAGATLFLVCGSFDLLCVRVRLQSALHPLS